MVFWHLFIIHVGSFLIEGSHSSDLRMKISKGKLSWNHQTLLGNCHDGRTLSLSNSAPRRKSILLSPLYPLCSPSKDEWISLLLHQRPMSAFIIYILLGKPRQSKLLRWSKGLCNPTSDNSQSQVRAGTIPSHCTSCLFNIHDPWVPTRDEVKSCLEKKNMTMGHWWSWVQRLYTLWF